MTPPRWAARMADSLAIGGAVPLARLARACGVVPEAFRKRAAELGATRQTTTTRWGVWVVRKSVAVKILTQYGGWKLKAKGRVGR